MIPRPIAGEYVPYASLYINKVEQGADVIFLLENNMHTIKEYLLSLPEEKLDYRYASNKWNIKEILQHIIDTERIFSYRALCFARFEKNHLHSYDENEYAKMSFSDTKNIEDLILDYENVRHATLSLFQSFDKTVYDNIGYVEKSELSVRAIAYILAGHELHHVDIIKERYF